MENKKAFEKQEFKTAWCDMCKNMRKFVSTLNPVGFWICTCCHYRTDKLLEKVGFRK